MTYILVGVAGAIGAISRYMIGLWLVSNNPFPLATLITNLFGCFLLAFLSAYFLKKVSLPTSFITAIQTGLIGSFTTFSTFSVETIQLFQNGEFLLSTLYVLTSLFGGLFMTKLGLYVGKEA
ncbi:CrcB protein [Oikeobacillus pervagus]|uniref:Fluoride-specific ion channel FluC n=1 Tax=Oikeobacillus pervagus TaxID=1325931 RepID=A0AAJ1WI44_9BACI|nr:fluoride efflux transporter CrcB [Oikeobacillus pervagus]MDQ0214008.1 CrcB protein [Oikeobacillus pervagus]